MKKLIPLLSVLFFVGCVDIAVPKMWEVARFYEVNLGEGQKAFFEGPSDGALKVNAGEGEIKVGACLINFAPFPKALSNVDESFFDELYKKERQTDGAKYEAWFDGELLVLYLGRDKEIDFGFWIYDKGGVTECIDQVEAVTETISDEAKYINRKYGIAFVLPHLGYELDYYENGRGVLLKRDLMRGEESFEERITVTAIDNIDGALNVMEFVDKKYPKSEFSPVEYFGLKAVYGEEPYGSNVKRSFFIMSRDKSMIYEIAVQRPAAYFDEVVREDFERFVQRLEIF